MATSPTLAVIGSSTTIGRAVLGALAERERPVMAVDATRPDMPPGGVEVRLMDVRDRLLPLTLEEVDTVVHAAFCDDLAASPDRLYGINVGGTRNLLEAASKAGVRRLVLLSSATVYGAHADNPVPLHEDDHLRANPGFAYAYQRQLVEEMVADWADAHPAAEVTVLRVAAVLGPGVDTALTRLLAGPRLVIPAGGTPLWQFVHIADVARAVTHVLDDDIVGTFNVAADGWLTSDEVAAALGTRVLEVGQVPMEQVLRAGQTAGISPAPPESLAYLNHPWVLDVTRLRDTGWRPTFTNREALAVFGESVAGTVAIGSLTLQRAAIRRVAMAFAGLVALTIWRATRR